MKKIFAVALTIAIFSCNTNQNKSEENILLNKKSNLELAKLTIDEILRNADHYQDNPSTIKAPYGSKLSFQLDSIKARLNKKDLEEFNEYVVAKFDVKYKTEKLSNLEIAKSIFNQILENADYYENNKSSITAPYGSKLSFQLKAIKAKLNKKDLEEFNKYTNEKFDEKYSNS